MNNETLNQLNAFVADYKKESEEKDAIIKKQNQILLHIKAELEAIKQYDPFDRVLVSCSIENISAIIKEETKPLIDEECVGCCRVQCDTELIERLSMEIHNRDKTIKDLKSKLSEKPDTIGMLNYTTNIEKVVLERRADDNTIEELENTIEELKDKNIEDLHELYDLYEAELRGIKADRTSIKSDRDIMFRNYHNTIAKLREDIRGLEVELAEKQEIIDKITSLRVDEVEALYCLEAELSARKEDSAVLMKVVDAIRAMTEDARTCPQIDHLSLIVKDYLGAPEGPPETSIDDLYKVTVTYAFLEMP